MAAATKTKAAPARASTVRAAPPPVAAVVPLAGAPAPRPVMPAPPQIPAQQMIQVPTNRAVAIGRDGKPIWRSAPMGGADPFAIDPAIIPDNWTYEWKRYAVAGQVDHAYQAQLARIGKWTPVMAESHDGVFLPPGSTGSIIIDGLILMERPTVLHREAQQDERDAANAVMRKARSERGLQVPGGVTGVSTQTAAAQGASFVNVTRAFASAEDKAALASIPREAYDYERNTID